MSFNYEGYHTPFCVNTTGFKSSGSDASNNSYEAKSVAAGYGCNVSWNGGTCVANANCSKVGGGNMAFSFYF
jgi:hypothetical protein